MNVCIECINLFINYLLIILSVGMIFINLYIWVNIKDLIKDCGKYLEKRYM